MPALYPRWHESAMKCIAYILDVAFFHSFGTIVPEKKSEGSFLMEKNHRENRKCCKNMCDERRTERKNNIWRRSGRGRR